MDSVRPAATEYPNLLRLPEPYRGQLPSALGLLIGLVALCAVPRAIMALKLGSVCPDGIFYIQLSESLQRGDWGAAFREMGLNPFPAVLVLLHRAGLGWELAGKLWGVTVSSLAVLPLYGWARRQFSPRVALVTSLLYVFHPKVILWTPELIRDPTFWFAFVLSLYLLWRAVTEVRLGWFAVAGLAMACAMLTRFEGVFLLLPLGLWSFWRIIALRAGRGRLALGVVLCVAALPAMLLLVNALWLRNHSHWEGLRGKPLELLGAWLGYVGGKEPTLAAYPDFVVLPARMSPGALGWKFLQMGTAALTPCFALLMFGGIWVWRRLWLRRDHQPPFYVALAIIAGINIHLWYVQGSNDRYLLPIALMGSVFAALALIGLAGWLARQAARFGPGSMAGLVGSGAGENRILAGLLVIFAAIGCVNVIAADTNGRWAEPELGKLIEREVGSPAVVLGSGGRAAVVGYYAHGTAYTLPMGAQDAQIAAAVEEVRPDALLLGVTHGMRGAAAQRYEPLIRKLEANGFSEVAPAQLPPGCQRWTLLLRPRNNRNTVARNPATQR